MINRNFGVTVTNCNCHLILGSRIASDSFRHGMLRNQLASLASRQRKLLGILQKHSDLRVMVLTSKAKISTQPPNSQCCPVGSQQPHSPSMSTASSSPSSSQHWEEQRSLPGSPGSCGPAPTGDFQGREDNEEGRSSLTQASPGASLLFTAPVSGPVSNQVKPVYKSVTATIAPKPAAPQTAQRPVKVVQVPHVSPGPVSITMTSQATKQVVQSVTPPVQRTPTPERIAIDTKTNNQIFLMPMPPTAVPSQGKKIPTKNGAVSYKQKTQKQGSTLGCGSSVLPQPGNNLNDRNFQSKGNSASVQRDTVGNSRELSRLIQRGVLTPGENVLQLLWKVSQNC